MKIACLIHSLSGGGAERVMAGLTSRLAVRGHEVTLICLGDGTGDRHHVDEAVQRVSLDVMGNSSGAQSAVRNLHRRVRAIRSATRSIDPDVLLSFCDRTNVLAGLAANGAVPAVLSERSDPSFQKLSPPWRLLRRISYQRADVIVAQTQASVDYFAGWKVPSIVIPSAVDPPPVLRDAKVAIANRRVIAIGRLAAEKGFDRLLDAFALTRQTHPDWTLRILGDGPLRSDLESQADRLGLSNCVEMPGWVHPVWDELASASIFVLPSRYEGFPSVLLEAMACGVPSIAITDQSGSRAIVDHQSNGLLIEGSKESISSAINSLIDDGEFRERLADHGKSVIDRFSWQSMVDQYEQVLSGL